MILRLPCAVANPTSIASTTNATPPTVLFAPHHCRKTAALKANKIRNLFYFTEFLFFLSPPIATQYGVGYAYCPMGNTATQLAPIAAQYGARIAIAMYKRHECKYINTRFHSLSSRNPLMGFIWNRASFTPGVAGGYSP